MLALNQHSKLGKILYEKNFWTGKTTITVDGILLTRINSVMYTYEKDGTTYTVIVMGNAFSGVKLNFSTNEKGVRPIIVPMVLPFKAVEYVIAFIATILVSLWISVGIFIPTPILKMDGFDGLVCGIIAVIGLFIAGRTGETRYRIMIMVIANLLGLGLAILMSFL